MAPYRLLPGLPGHGDPPRSFPESWGRFGREGTVVEFQRANGSTWVGNFRPGLGGVSDARMHPDGYRVVVFANGDLWTIDPETGSADQTMVAVDGLWPVSNPDGLVMSRQGLAFLRLGPEGVIWHTRRLSWDGFSEVRLDAGAVSGLAWDAVNQRWLPFKVDLPTGRSVGGSFSDEDAEGWERIHSQGSAA